MNMWKTGIMTAVLAAGTTIGALAAGIGVVNVDQAAAAHPQIKAMERQLQQIETKYEPQLQAMVADLQTKKTEAEVQAAVNGKYDPLLKEYFGAREQAQAKIISDLEKAIEKVRKDKKLDAVLVAPVQVASKDPKEQIIDITEDVQRALR